jgi:hypothetical protein
MEAKMNHLLLKTGVVAGACALAFLAAPGTAKAVSPVPLNGTGSLAIPVQDQENLSVEEDLRPDEPPSDFEAGAPDKYPNQPPHEAEGKSSGNIEDEMVDKIGPGAE